MPSLFRSPLLHFVVIGALLYAARPLTQDGVSVDVDAHRIAIGDERLDEMRRSFAEQAGRRPEPDELARMITAEVDEEILYREAIARGLLERDGGVQTRLIQKMLFLEGEADLADAPILLARAIELELHHEDVVVRRILVQKMRLLGSSLAKNQRVSHEEIAAAYERQRETLRAPDRLSVVHVFLSVDRRGEGIEAEAKALLEELARTGTLAAEGPARGDPFPLGHHLARRSQYDLERTFGAEFGASVFETQTDGWVGPIASAYGLHLVRVTAREAGQVPPLEGVADRLRLQLEAERREANLEALLTDLRARYFVVVPTRAAENDDTRENG